jgi:hypothetical protein
LKILRFNEGFFELLAPLIGRIKSRMRVFKPFSVLLLALCSWGMAAAEFKEAEITTIKNMVEHDPGTGSAPAKVSEKIQEKSKVSTAAASMAELTFADSSITRMGANTQFSFQSKERLVKLEQGSVLVNTPPGKGGAVVDCGGVTGAVSGTTFLASRDASGGVMFVMLEGSGTLKVTVPNGGGGTVVKEIRPGQAASVGSATVKTAEKANAGGPPPAPEPESGSPRPAAKAEAIQVFDVDVKKIVETAPLIREFKTELPSMKKIEKTIEVQQAAVKEGRMEKLEVEVVAVKEDGDVLVGSPRIDEKDMRIVNRREERPGGKPQTGDNLDIDTAAGPGAGGGNVANARPAPGPAPVDAPRGSGPAASGGSLGVIGQTATALAGGITPDPILSSRAPEGTVVMGDPVNPLALTLSGPTKRAGVGRLSINVAGVIVTKPVLVAAGITQFEILGTGLPDPKVYAPGGVEATVTLSVTAATGTITETITLASRPVSDPVVQAANPARLFSTTASMSPQEKGALDIFFYFQNKAPGVTTGPSKLFADASLQTTRDFRAVFQDPTEAIQLYAGQTHDFFAAKIFQPALGDLFLEPSAGRNGIVAYANQWAMGQGGAAMWEGLSDPTLDDTSLGFQAVNRNKEYAPIYNTDPAVGPIGFFDIAVGTLPAPLYGLENFPVWDDGSAGSFLSSAFSWSLGDNAKSLTLAAGAGGAVFEGLDLQANGNRVEILSVGDLKITTSRLRGLGSGGATGSAALTLETQGKMVLGGATESRQVRLEGVDTGAGVPMPGSLAIVRAGDSLEIRNLTIRNFADVKLEKTGTAGGRILLSGVTVRDFKIKELVGAAVNADAKIQMMAVDQNGDLAGTLTVENRLPVERALAGKLDASLSGTLASQAVDAAMVDLAAETVKFQQAQIAAMNAIHVRAQTILVQNSFMTVIRDRGMINMYVRDGQVNTTYGTTVDGKVNFAGNNGFRIGSTQFSISNQAELTAAYGNTLLDIGQNGGNPQAGKVNVLKL